MSTAAPPTTLDGMLADHAAERPGDAAVVLGGAEDGKVALVASFTASAVERGLSAADVVREAAAVVGGGASGTQPGS